MNHRSLKYTAVLASAFALAGSALAQTIDEPSAAPAPAPASTEVAEETIILTPFEVTTERDTGYAATDTLAGTRIRTDLKDIASPISVVTREFMNDIGAVDNASLLQYTNNTEVGGVRTTYAGLGNGTSVNELATLGTPNSNTRVRGLSAADNTRDYFGTDIPWDSYNVDRVDIQRGPNSILFGLGKPAGIINASLRGAEFKNSGEVQMRYGAYGTARASFGINQQIIPRMLAVRVDQLWNKEKFRQDPAYASDRRTSLAVRFDPDLFKNRDFTTSLKVKFENGDIHSNRPRTVTPNDLITPFFRPKSHAWGGLGGQTQDVYWVEWETTPVNPVSDGRGQNRSADTADYNPWVASGLVNQQQPAGFFDGSTGQLQQLYGGYIPWGGRNATGGNDNTMAAIPYNAVMVGVNSLSDYAIKANLPGAKFGQYRMQSLQDASIFDFYNNLIDGPNKREWSHWNAYNIDLSQTAWGDRVGVRLLYDNQRFNRGQSALFDWPGLNIDITSRRQDLSANPNAGRPFIQGSGGGSSYESERESIRGTLYAEFKSTDLLDKGFLTKVLGRHRVNGVFSTEEYTVGNIAWNNYGTSESFDTYALGSPLSVFERNPQAIVYLGDSLLGASSASGAHIPRVKSRVELNDGSLYHFKATWNAASSVNFGDTWNRSTTVWNQFAKPNDPASWTQSENPANYIGWNSNYNLDILDYQDGDTDLTKSASKAYRKVKSWAGTLQSFWWDDALVSTIGWRSDTVQSKEIAAKTNASLTRNRIDLNPSVFNLDAAPMRSINDHSLSWGGVLHLNKILQKDFLPINISLSYNRASNFEVAGTRTDVYGHEIGPSTGKTKDIGIRLATKDDKYSLRATKYESSVKDASSSAGFNPAALGAIVARGLAWTNIFEFDLGGYTASTQGNTSVSWRYNFGARPGQTADEAAALERSVIAAWRDLQFKLNPDFYNAWGLTGSYNTFVYDSPSDTSADLTRLQAYAATTPSSFAITEDTESKGYEFELVANPTRNWRISANASRTIAVRSNIGGPALNEFVGFIDHYMYETDAGKLREFSGDPGAATMEVNRWNAAFRGAWTLKQLQEGSAVPEIRKWRYNLTSNYSFRKGLLKGAGVGASYRWEDKVVIGYPVVADNSPAGGTFDLSKPYYGPSEDALDLWLSYERKLTSRVNWKIQLNVRNVFGDKGLIPISLQPDGRTWASVRIAPDRDWFLTNTFSF